MSGHRRVWCGVSIPLYPVSWPRPAANTLGAVCLVTLAAGGRYEREREVLLIGPDGVRADKREVRREDFTSHVLQHLGTSCQSVGNLHGKTVGLRAGS